MRLIRGSHGGSANPEIGALASMFVAAVLMTAVALIAVFIAGEQPPRLVLAGAEWQWTGSEAGAGEAPITVPEPAKYTVRFARDGTFLAVADCNRVSGTYTVVPAGRAGGSTNHLALVPGPGSLAPCGEGSLSVEFLQQLDAAASYAIGGTQLTIALDPRGTMTFRAAGPAAVAAPAG